MKAQIGDYVRTLKNPQTVGDGPLQYDLNKVILIEKWDDTETYILANGGCIYEDELTIDDVLLESEVEVGDE